MPRVLHSRGRETLALTQSGLHPQFGAMHSVQPPFSLAGRVRERKISEAPEPGVSVPVPRMPVSYSLLSLSVSFLSVCVCVFVCVVPRIKRARCSGCRPVPFLRGKEKKKTKAT